MARLRELSWAQGEGGLLSRALDYVSETIEVTDRLTLVYWRPTRGRIDDNERELIPVQALLEVTRDHVIGGTLPEAVRAAWIRDGRRVPHWCFSQHGATHPGARDASLIYLKVEETHRQLEQSCSPASSGTA